ncbi:hypothetical protein ASC77_24175 [Nocardioides sp. Root1257]|uniref:hypothetical protein n=1 Tax=unclassified Nocardioides TaxID=2615069 RepID=UPI0006FA476C|nr:MULTISPECIES: hypothetical protein [unclassified Nocardioides]KQW52484.1 hypothetical protein ASC77_24175 [Nocardioides sp. Root1257]KRC54546.1 hypothetical protein ASE24_23965 [Nocardioides sp. Root224]
MAADRDLGEEEWGDEPELPEDAPPYWFAGQHLPEHARAMGLTHHVPEGAILDFAGRLDSTKPGHRAAAWCLLVLFGTPVVLAVLRVYYAFS